MVNFHFNDICFLHSYLKKLKYFRSFQNKLFHYYAEKSKLNFYSHFRYKSFLQIENELKKNKIFHEYNRLFFYFSRSNLTICIWNTIHANEWIKWRRWWFFFFIYSLFTKHWPLSVFSINCGKWKIVLRLILSCCRLLSLQILFFFYHLFMLFLSSHTFFNFNILVNFFLFLFRFPWFFSIYLIVLQSQCFTSLSLFPFFSIKCDRIEFGERANRYYFFLLLRWIFQANELCCAWGAFMHDMSMSYCSNFLKFLPLEYFRWFPLHIWSEMR